MEELNTNYRQNEISHYGVKGMHLSIRRSKKQNIKAQSKKHLGIDDNGNINIISGKTSDRAKKNFIIKTSLWASSMALTTYVATHPDTIYKGEKVARNILKKMGQIKNKAMPVDSGIYSKNLGRMLSIAEAMDLGFDLSDQ